MVESKINGAYAIIIDDIKKEFLLVQWGKIYGFTWHFPGGTAESDETLKETLKREVKEELNIDVDIIKKVLTKYCDITDCRFIRKGRERTCNFFICKIRPNQEIKLDKDELNSYKWFKKEDIDNIDFFMNYYAEMLKEVLPF